MIMIYTFIDICFDTWFLAVFSLFSYFEYGEKRWELIQHTGSATRLKIIQLV